MAQLYIGTTWGALEKIGMLGHPLGSLADVGLAWALGLRLAPTSGDSDVQQS